MHQVYIVQQSYCSTSTLHGFSIQFPSFLVFQWSCVQSQEHHRPQLRVEFVGTSRSLEVRADLLVDRGQTRCIRKKTKRNVTVSWELIPEAKQGLNRISHLWNSWWIKSPNNFVLKRRISWNRAESSCQEKWQEALAALQQLEPEADVTLSKPSAGDHCFWYGSYHQLLPKCLVSEKCCVMFTKPGRNDTTLSIACSAMLAVTWGNYLQQRHQSLWWSNTVAACLAFDTPCEAQW